MLAAGGAQRFGGPKQLARLNGRPLLEHALMSIAGVEEIERAVVVLGAYANRILDEVDLHGLHPVLCRDWQEGLAASLRAGIVSMKGADAIVVLLGDQPGVTPEAVRRVLAVSKAPTPLNARATYGGIPGHPTVLTGRTLDEAVGLRGDVGAQRLLSGDGVRLVPCDDVADPSDVDRPSDLDELVSGL